MPISKIRETIPEIKNQLRKITSSRLFKLLFYMNMEGFSFEQRRQPAVGQHVDRQVAVRVSSPFICCESESHSHQDSPGRCVGHAGYILVLQRRPSGVDNIDAPPQ